MEGHFTMDERRWREKVRRFEFEAKDLRAERDKQKARADALEEVVCNADKLHREIAEALGRADMPNDLLVPTADSLRTEHVSLTSENKELKDKIKGLNMQLGRFKNKG